MQSVAGQLEQFNGVINAHEIMTSCMHINVRIVKLEASFMSRIDTSCWPLLACSFAFDRHCFYTKTQSVIVLLSRCTVSQSLIVWKFIYNVKQLARARRPNANIPKCNIVHQCSIAYTCAIVLTRFTVTDNTRW